MARKKHQIERTTLELAKAFQQEAVVKARAAAKSEPMRAARPKYPMLTDQVGFNPGTQLEAARDAVKKTGLTGVQATPSGQYEVTSGRAYDKLVRSIGGGAFRNRLSYNH